MSLVIPILIVLALLWVLLAAVAVQPEPSVPNSLPHPDIDGMMAGSDGLARLAEIGWPAFSLQAATLILVVLMIALGVSRRYRSLPFWLALAATAILFLFVWSRIFLGHQVFLNTGEVQYVLGFPAPTAWVGYGIWTSGLALLVLYVAGFRKFIYTHEDEAEFDRLVEEHREGGGPALQEGETPSLPERETPSLQEGETPSLQEGETPSLQEGETPSLQEGETPSLQEGETPSLPERD